MKNLILFISLFLALTSFAGHREHGVHQHGAGTLGIVFEEGRGKLDFKFAGESIIGFEYVPKTDKDKKIQKTQLALLESRMPEMVVFEPSLKCTIVKEKIEVPAKDSHTEVLASFDVQCLKSPLGTRLTFNFQKYFPRLHDLDVQIIAGTVQKSAEARKNNTVVELK